MIWSTLGLYLSLKKQAYIGGIIRCLLPVRIKPICSKHYAWCESIYVVVVSIYLTNYMTWTLVEILTL